MIISTPTRMINSDFVVSVELERTRFGETPSALTFYMATGKAYRFEGREAEAVHRALGEVVSDGKTNRYSKFKTIECRVAEEDK